MIVSWKIIVKNKNQFISYDDFDDLAVYGYYFALDRIMNMDL